MKLLVASVMSLAAGLLAVHAAPTSELAATPTASIIPPLPNLFPTTTRPAPTTTTTSSSTTTTATTAPAPTTTVPPPVPSDPPPGVNPGDPHYPGQPQYTKLRLTLDSAVQWAQANLNGVGYVIGEVVEGDYRASVLRDGIALMGPGRAVVDIVVTLPPQDIVATICKASGGAVRLTVTRITGPEVPVGVVDDNVQGDQVVQGCANRAAATMPHAALAPTGAWPVPVDTRRLVLAFFYHYWDSQSFNPNPWIETPHSPYDTVNQLHEIIDVAQGAGINGFISSYQNDPNTDGRWEQLVRTAESENGFTVAPLLEVSTLAASSPNQPVAVSELEPWFRDVLAPAGSPAFLTVRGRPVVFMFGTRDVSPSVLAGVRANLRATGLDPFIVGDDIDLAYALDGFYAYTPNVVQESRDLPDWMWHLSRTTRFEHDRGMGDRPALLASPVSPGENDSRVPRGSGTLGIYIDREAGARYDATWAAAIATRPDWVVVSTWNSFIEDTQITPGDVYGTRALDQTRSWAQLFHTA